MKNNKQCRRNPKKPMLLFLECYYLTPFFPALSAAATRGAPPDNDADLRVPTIADDEDTDCLVRADDDEDTDCLGRADEDDPDVRVRADEDDPDARVRADEDDPGARIGGDEDARIVAGILSISSSSSSSSLLEEDELSLSSPCR